MQETISTPFYADLNGKPHKAAIARVLSMSLSELQQHMQICVDKKLAHATASGQWYGATMSEYQDILAHGWKETVPSISDIPDMLADNMQQNVLQRSVAGAFPVVPAYIAGDMNSMLMLRKDYRERLQVHLVIDIAFNWRIDNGTVKEYARQVMRLVNWLEAQQVATKVTCVWASALSPAGTKCTSRQVSWNTFVLPVQDYSQVLQPERIGAFCHPALLRRGFLGLTDSLTESGDVIAAYLQQHSYGYPGDLMPMELVRQLFPDDGSVILLPKPGTGDPQKTVQDAINLKLNLTQE